MIPLPANNHGDFYHWKHEIGAILAGLLGGARYGVKIRLPHALVMTTVFRKDLSSRGKLRQILRMTFEHATHLAAFATIYKSVLGLLKFMDRQSRHSSGQCQIGKEEPITTTLRWIWNLIVRGSVARHENQCNRALSSTTTTTTSSSTTLVRSSSLPGRPERLHHAFIAGAVGGYLIWGHYTSVNYQIVLYLVSRVLVAAVKRLVVVRREAATGEPSNRSTWLSRIIHSSVTYRLVATAVWGIVMILFEESPELLHPSLKASMDEIYRYQLSSPQQLQRHGTAQHSRKMM